MSVFDDALEERKKKSIFEEAVKTPNVFEQAVKEKSNVFQEAVQEKPSWLQKAGQFLKNVGFQALTENPLLKPLRTPPPQKVSDIARNFSLEEFVDTSIKTAKEGAEAWVAKSKDRGVLSLEKHVANLLSTILPANLNEFAMNAAIGGMAGQEILPIMEGISKKLPDIIGKAAPQRVEALAKQFISKELDNIAKLTDISDITKNLEKRAVTVTKESKKIVNEAIDFVKNFDEALDSPPIEPIKINLFNKTPSLNTKAPRKVSVEKPLENIFASPDMSRVIKRPNRIQPLSEVTQEIPVQSRVLKNITDDKYARPSSINVKRLDLTEEGELFARNVAKSSGIKNPTFDQLKEIAKDAEVFKTAMTQQELEKFNASLLRTRQKLTNLANKQVLSKEFFDTLDAVSSRETFLGGGLGAQRIVAGDVADSAFLRINKKLRKIGIDVDALIREGKNVDWDNHKEVVKFYRKFVKPSVREIIDEMRYISMLSSPKTHIINFTTNLIQGMITRPATRLATAGIDVIKSMVKGTEREFLFKQVPAYYKGMFGSTKEAFKEAVNVLKGRTEIFRPDLTNIPTESKLTKPFYPVLRFLEASDKFWRTLITGAEQEALIKGGMEKGKALQEAAKTAEELIFRKALDAKNKTGQGKLLSNIDKFTGIIYKLRESHPTVRWFVPFLQTPMNILKQGIEYSPLGIMTLRQNTHKVEQLGKMFVGSAVMGLSGWAAAEDKVTWAMPKNQKDKEVFINTGRKPYSININGHDISLIKLGPLAYPFAMAAAIKWYAKDNPKAVTDSVIEKTSKAIAGIAEFFSDQSYVEGFGDLIDIVNGGDEKALNAFLSVVNLGKQLIPLAGLEGWIARIVDPIYRNPEKDFTIKSIKDSLAVGIPGLSKTVEPYETLEGEPSKRDYPLGEAISPFNIGKIKPEFEEHYQERLQAGREIALISEERKLYQEAFKELDQNDINRLMDFLNTQPPEMKKKVYGDIKKSIRKKGIPNKYWYDAVKSFPNSVGAKLFTQKLNKLSPKDKAGLWADAQKYGILTSDFLIEYGKSLKK